MDERGGNSEDRIEEGEIKIEHDKRGNVRKRKGKRKGICSLVGCMKNLNAIYGWNKQHF